MSPTTETRQPVDVLPDEDLVQLARAGDARAYEALVGRHQAVVYRVAARIVGHDEADDVSQDAFIRGYHRLDQIRGAAAFRPWILQVTRSVALNTLRRRLPDPTDEIEAVATAKGEEGPPPPASLLEEKERRERLETKVAMLSDNHRAVLVLRDIEGFSYEEIAAITETPLGSVKGRIHRARGEMIGLLRNNTYDWNLPDG